MTILHRLTIALAVSGAVFAIPAMAAPTDGQPARPAKVSAADQNGDGFVDKVEWQAQRDRIFQRLDTDRDGKLSRDEMQRAKAQSGRAAKAAGDGQMRDNNGKPRADRFARLDTDGDGFISRSEFAAASDLLFARCDVNGDGRIARGECRSRQGRAARGTRSPGDAVLQ